MMRPDSAAETPVVVLLRRDLRLADHPALAAAAATGRPLIPLYVLDAADPYPINGARAWWLHHALASLGRALAAKGSSLVLRRDNTEKAIRSIVGETGADLVCCSRRTMRAEDAADRKLFDSLAHVGVELRRFPGALLREPENMRTPSGGGAYRVFTPFFKRLEQLGPDRSPLPPPKALRAAKSVPRGETLDDFRLLPTRPNWASEFGDHWRPGEDNAWEAARAFAEGPIKRYAERRDFPADPATSRLSPHLAFGEISPTALWTFITREGSGAGARKTLSEIAWREFSAHLLFAFPEMATAPLQPRFADFPYRDDRAGLRKWTRGETGYPIVDAGMRQLWRTGWMHNRVRLIVASFLTKDLLIDWREGEKWFADTLVDYEPASNVANWQWVAGSGADAAPYFRIFNPTSQGEKFDPDGDYVRAWAPELANVPAKYIHRPDEAPAEVLAEAKVKLGRDYPAPIIDHGQARRRALEAYGATAPDGRLAAQGTHPYVN